MNICFFELKRCGRSQGNNDLVILIVVECVLNSPQAQKVDAAWDHLGWGLVNFFCQEPGSEYLRLCRL